MAKFKVGDKVRVVKKVTKDDFEGIKIGDIGKVVDVCVGSEYPIFLKINRHDEYGFEEEELELVKEEAKMEKTVLEIMNEGYTGKKYIHEFGTIVYVDHKNTLRFDYSKSNLKSGDGAIGRCIVLDMKLKEYRKEYTFEEALKVAEENEGKIIENKVSKDKYKIKDKKLLIFVNPLNDWLDISGFRYAEIKGGWYIND